MTALGIAALAFIAAVGAAGVGLVAWAAATDKGIQRPRRVHEGCEGWTPDRCNCSCHTNREDA